MNPILRIGDVEVVLHPLQVVSVATDQLGVVIDSLADHGQTRKALKILDDRGVSTRPKSGQPAQTSNRTGVQSRSTFQGP